MACYTSPKVCQVNREVYYFPLFASFSWSLLSTLCPVCSQWCSWLMLCSLARSSWTTPFGCRLRVTGLGSVVYGRAYIEVVSRPLGVALVRFFSNFNGHQPQNWQSVVPDTAVSCRLTRLTSRREFAGLSVWQPRKGENKRNESESCRLCDSHPPSLVCPPLGFPFLGTLQCQVWP